jgi:hypothetical protein
MFLYLYGDVFYNGFVGYVYVLHFIGDDLIMVLGFLVIIVTLLGMFLVLCGVFSGLLDFRKWYRWCIWCVVYRLCLILVEVIFVNFDGMILFLVAC